MRFTRPTWLALVIGGVMASAASSQSTAPQSTFAVQQQDSKRGDLATVQVIVEGRGTDGSVSGLPCRVQMTAPEGQAVDGGGRGLYQDGRFFVEGSFEVSVLPGDCEVSISAGPNYVPLEMKLTVSAGQQLRVKATLEQWFSPEEKGWFSGDHHVHAQHDREAEIKTSLAYAALQGRANGLSFVTEAGSHIDYGELVGLSSDRFQIRRAGEIRPGPFIGHLNTPGCSDVLSPERLAQALRQPLPVQTIRTLVESGDGIVIHTHPLTPRHQIHWMGAGEYFSDIVCGRAAHALDIDSRESELLLFAGLNLGNRIAVSSYTDSALGRRSTSSPGDRRVYVLLDPSDRVPLNYDAMVHAFRQGRSIATNGGPLFGTWSINGKQPGDVVVLPTNDAPLTAHLAIDHLYPLSKIELIRRGRTAESFSPVDRPLHWHHEIRLPSDLSDGDWLILRVEDERGHWSMTSPIYMRSESSPSVVVGQAADAILFQISNATRFVELRPQFFAHLIVTVDPRRVIESVTLTRDGTEVMVFDPAQGQRIGPAGKLPVTAINGEYEPGWVWFPDSSKAVHLQADWPITDTGWYQLDVRTSDGEVRQTLAMYFDRASNVSHQISQVRLSGPDTRLQLLGYSEEMNLDEIRLPFEGDHWWYPQQAIYQLEARLGGQEYRFGSNETEALAEHFR